eukprot:TRINITY_DN1099_c0_g1_i5.p1 TRINITY_DN1099_c0_g1~~TRINITY_DN1099_c0_g1_i5.p1  ORF type:complete len:785 (+),score=244.47 TRINITY_DN1099_c0_g1_i5:131-2356(+)
MDEETTGNHSNPSISSPETLFPSTINNNTTPERTLSLSSDPTPSIPDSPVSQVSTASLSDPYELSAVDIDKDKQRYVKTEEIINVGHRRTVYRAYDDEEGRDVAWIEYKDVPLAVAEAVDMNFRSLFALTNPYIVKYLSAWVEIDEKQNNAIFITELPPSYLTLKQYSSNQLMKFPIKIIKRWCRQIASGLHFLCSNNFYHRDLQCDNIYIDSNNGKVLIATLELSTFIDSTHPASFDGTPGFVDPEIGNIGFREDKAVVYSFGCCVLELITGLYPYMNYTSAVEIIKASLSGQTPPELDQVQDELACDFIRTCMLPQKNRPTMDELLKHPFLSDETVENLYNGRGASMHGRQIVIELRRSPSQDSTSSGLSESSRKGNVFDDDDSDEELVAYESKKAQRVVLVDPSMAGMDTNGDFGLEIASDDDYRQRYGTKDEKMMMNGGTGGQNTNGGGNGNQGNNGTSGTGGSETQNGLMGSRMMSDDHSDHSSVASTGSEVFTPFNGPRTRSHGEGSIPSMTLAQSLPKNRMQGMKCFVMMQQSPLESKPYDGCVRMDLRNVTSLESVFGMISADFGLGSMARIDLFYTDEDGDVINVLPRTTIDEIRRYAVSITAYVSDSGRSVMMETNKSTFTTVGLSPGGTETVMNSSRFNMDDSEDRSSETTSPIPLRESTSNSPSQPVTPTTGNNDSITTNQTPEKETTDVKLKVVRGSPSSAITSNQVEEVVRTNEPPRLTKADLFDDD